MAETLQPYYVRVADEIVSDLRRRLDQTRWPDAVEHVGWEYGMPLNVLRQIVDYWRTQFDWRAQERYINSFANYRIDLNGIGVHFVHERGRGPHPLPLIITHGWPSSFYEMLKLVPLLTDPAGHGGDASDAFDVIIPSVPGHGFSDRPTHVPLDDYVVAKLWIQLMEELGFEQFGAHAHDLGASITGLLCLHHPGHVIGYHTTNPGNPSPPIPPDAADLTEAEREYLAYRREYAQHEIGYAQILSTRPQTLAYGLNDSPVGLAAWILEKWYKWTTGPDDTRPFPFSQDELLANVMIYWVTQTINSANRYYATDAGIPWPKPGDRVRVPMGIALTAQPIERPPREYVERLYPDIRHWIDLRRGGHFVALEEPQAVAESIRTFFRPLR